MNNNKILCYLYKKILKNEKIILINILLNKYYNFIYLNNFI